MDRSNVHVYTGDGKGKTTAAFGLALRASGWSMRSLVAQFFKDRESGERNACNSIDEIKVETYGSSEFIVDGVVKEDVQRDVKEGFNRTVNAVKNEDWDIVIFDELNLAIYYDVIDLAEVRDMIDDRRGTEIVITGRKAPEELLEYADLVTAMENIKHPYDKGVKARKGIEY